MAYRRRQGITKSATFKEETNPPRENIDQPSVTKTPSFTYSSLRDSPDFDKARSKGFTAYEGETKGFWGSIAQKAKSILDEDNPSRLSGTKASPDRSTGAQSRQSYPSNEGFKKMDSPTIRRGLDKLTSSLNQIGGTFEKAFEEGRTIVESKTADIIQETRKLQNRRKGTGSETQNQASGLSTSYQPSPMQPLQSNQTDHETQLKASRDVAMATAAKAKLLLRELKTVKADLAFAKERCAQLEEENKSLRENREKGSNPADDDLIRLQLESLLAEKARLAHENSIYARENRFLREIVEYHQLTMQDVVYIDECSEEVTEVYPSISRTLSVTTSLPSSPSSPSELPQSESLPVNKETHPFSEQHPDQEGNDASINDMPPSSASDILVPGKNDVKRPSESSV